MVTISRIGLFSLSSCVRMMICRAECSTYIGKIVYIKTDAKIGEHTYETVVQDCSTEKL